MALTYEKFYGGVSNAEQLMYKKSCVYSKSKEGCTFSQITPSFFI